MRILLIRPPATFHRGGIKPSVSLPLGLLYIAAVLEAAGFTVRIYDAQLSPDRPVAGSGDEMVMGDLWEEVATEISRCGADIVGIGCGFSAQVPNTLKVIEIVRKVLPKALVVVGGAPASARPLEFLSAPTPADIVCIGEGEYTMLDIANIAAAGGDLSSVIGTAVATGGDPRCNPLRPRIEDLDQLPFPAYHLIRIEDYFRLQGAGYTDRPGVFRTGYERAVSVVTSRGCPYNCVFCSIHVHMGKRWRGNSVSYVLEHIRVLADSYGVRHLHFEDDNISFSAERFRGIVEGLPVVGPGITWDTPNGVRVDTLTRELVATCKQNGCTYLVFGVESGNQKVLDTVVDKRLDLATVLDAAKWCKKAELDAMAFFVIGFPGETPEEMQETVDFAIRLKRMYDVTPHLFVATPLPGTRLEKLCLEKGFLNAPLTPLELALMTQGNFPMNGGTFDHGDVAVIIARFFSAYRRVFALNSLLFFLRRPIALLAMLRLLPRMNANLSWKEKLLKAMQVKYAMLTSRRAALRASRPPALPLQKGKTE